MPWLMMKMKREDEIVEKIEDEKRGILFLWDFRENIFLMLKFCVQSYNVAVQSGLCQNNWNCFEH